MDWTYVQMMNSLSEHPKCYKRLSLMKEMWSKKIAHGFGQKQYGYRCGFLAWQSPGGSAVAMFKNIPNILFQPIHRWLPKSTTDPQHGLKICSNDEFPFWAPKMLQKALSNERDVIKKNCSWFWPETVWISLWLLGLAIPWRQLSSYV